MSNPYGPGYQALRPEVLARNGGTCAFCGIQPATETHHGMVVYPDHADLTADQLVQLCEDCHDFATSLRKWRWRFNAAPRVIFGLLREYMERPEFPPQVRDRLADDFKRIVTAQQTATAQRDITPRERGAIQGVEVADAPQRDMAIRERGPVEGVGVVDGPTREMRIRERGEIQTG